MIKWKSPLIGQVGVLQEGTVDENYPVDENDKTTWGFSSEWTSSTNILGLVVFRCSVHPLIKIEALEASPSQPSPLTEDLKQPNLA